MKTRTILSAIFVSIVAILSAFLATGNNASMSSKIPPPERLSGQNERLDEAAGEADGDIEPEKDFKYGNRMDPRDYLEAYAAIQQMPDEKEMDPRNIKQDGLSGVNASQWESVGPTRVATTTPNLFLHGRIRRMHWYLDGAAWVPYLGASSGGLWYGGSTPSSFHIMNTIGDNLPNPAVGDFLVSPANPNTIFVGTGDWGRGGCEGSGLYKTTDRGGTWAQVWLPITPSAISALFYTVNDLVMFVASNVGVFKSVNNGVTWDTVSIKTGSPFYPVYNLIASDPNTLYATIPYNGVYKSTNAGGHWDPLTNGLPSSNIGKTIAIDVSQSDPQILYAAYTDSNDNSRGIFKTTNGGTSWSQAGNPPGYIVMNQGFHTNVIRIHPLDPNKVYAGGVSLIRTTDGGANWADASGGHGDFTCIEFSHEDPNHMYLCNDGGIFERDDAANTVRNESFVFLPGAPIEEYGMDYAWSESGVLVAGTQDNGTMITTQAADPNGTWSQITGCDGANDISIDPANSSQFFWNSWCGTDHPRYRTSNQGSTSMEISNGLKQIWYSPIRLSKGGGQVLWTVTQANLYYSTNQGDTWKHATGGINDFDSTLPGSLTVNNWAPAGNKTCYLTFADNKSTPLLNEGTQFYAADGAPGSMTFRIGTLFGHMVKCIVPDRWNSDWAFGITQVDNPKRIYKSTNRGHTWTDISGNLPFNLEVSDIVVSQSYSQAMYIATPLGMFKTLNGGATWFKYQAGLPVVSVSSIAYIPGAIYDTLRIGTYGRGFYQRLVSDVDPTSYHAGPIYGPYNDGSFIQNNGIVVGDTGAIGQSTDNGATWHVTHYPPLARMRRVKLIDMVSAFAAGDGGALLRSGDGGQSWSPIVGITGENFSDMSFPTAGRGWLTTDGGKLIHTTNGGTGWFQQNDFTPQQLTACFFLDENRGWVAGTVTDPAGGGSQTGMMNITTDGGTTWNSLPLPVPTVNRMQFLDSRTGYGVGNLGAILKTTDGGLTWSTPPSGTTLKLSGLSFQDTTNGMACGESGVLLKTQNGGADWTMVGTGTTNSFSAIATSGNQLFVIGDNGVLSANLAQTNSVHYDLHERWNIVSLPVNVADSGKAVLFPASTSDAYSYDGSYQTAATLSRGGGYWLKFTDAQVVTVAGIPEPISTIHVKTGWNLIGSLPTYVPVNSIGSNPPGIVASQYYGFNNGYTATTTLVPGSGYWVKAGQDGDLLFGPGAGAGSTKYLTVSETSGLGSITFSDADSQTTSLYYGEAPEGNFALPPVPPAGAFDVRYATGTSTEGLGSEPSRELGIILSSARYPVRLRWSPSANPDLGTLIVDGTATPLRETGSILLSRAPGALALRLGEAGAGDIPKFFALDQNYPNPFNPSTVIQYDLPVESNVVVRIYNTVGQVVKVISDGVQAAGRKSLTWDASGLATGVYLCRLEAAGTATDGHTYTHTIKMLMMK